MEAPPEDMGSEPGTGGTAETSTQEAGLSSFRVVTTCPSVQLSPPTIVWPLQ